MLKALRQIERSAILTDDGVHRLTLTRKWAEGGHALLLGLNPSKADAELDDQTVRKLYSFGDILGFGSYELQNLWSYRSTDPKGLKVAGYPVIPQNDWHLIRALRDKPDFVICMWGANARGLGRPTVVKEILRIHDVQAKAFRLTPDGIPYHPLYQPVANPLVDFPL